jgi:hypothetical protein
LAASIAFTIFACCGAIAAGDRADEQQLVDAGEGVDHRLELEIVALEHLDAAVGEALRLLQVAGQHGDVAGGNSLQQVLHGGGAQVAGRAGHEILGHVLCPL